MRLPSSPLLCACVACLCLAGCSDEEAATPAVVRAARVAVVTPHKLALVAQGAGRIQSRSVSPVGFEVGGRLISRDVGVGMVVSKGQKLGELSDADYRNKVTAAEADLAAAKAALVQAAAQEERFRILLGKGFATRALHDEAVRSLQSAEAAVKATEANLRIAQNQLAHTRLVAPDRGVVTATGADPGQVVAPGQMIVEISRNDEREAVFAVASGDVARAKLGMAVKVWLQGRPDVAVIGSIREISPEADVTTGTYGVKVTLNSPPPDMRLGAVVVGRVESAGQEVTSLPSTALLQSGNQPQVWVMGNDGKVQRREIELLEFDTDTVVVKRGLSAGEKVVIVGVNALADGQLVKAEMEVQ